jgi:hypothetical protein
VVETDDGIEEQEPFEPSPLFEYLFGGEDSPLPDMMP